MKNTITKIANKVIELVTVTVDQLEAILTACTTSTVVSIVYLVDDTRSRKRGGKFQIQKRVEMSHVYMNHDYTNKVQNKTGLDFVARPLEEQGKTRISSTIIASLRTGAKMLDGKVLKAESVKSTTYFHNGVEITEAKAIAQDLWAPSYYNPKEKTTKGRGTVSKEDDFGIINPYLSRIEQIKFQGTIYKVQK